MPDRTTLPSIKPCPFCGGPASMVNIEKELGFVSRAVACDNKDCGAALRLRIQETHHAIEAWNQRGPVAPARKDELGDDDPFPFGKYKNYPMKRVPASYLLWMEDQDWSAKWPAVMEYVDRNRSVLEKEVEG